METHSRDEIFATLQRVQYGVVSTFDGEKIRSRTMHFAVTRDLSVYFATMRGDPKTVQMQANPSINLLAIYDNGDLSFTSEVEIQGRSMLVHDSLEREKALKMLCEKSPVVRSACEAKMSGIFEVIRLKPEMLKYRIFGEIVRGVAPTVINFEQVTEAPKDFLRALQAWYEELRAPFFTASLVPVLLGTAIAWAKLEVFNAELFLITLLGVLLLHAGTNMANDYFDHRSGNDAINREYVRPFTGGSRMIQKGLVAPRHVLAASLLCFALGSAVGLYLYFTTNGELILALLAVGAASGFFYTAPPLLLANRGLGEFAVALNFGVLVTLGSYYVQTLSPSLEALAASIPVALLITAVLYVNQFPDYAADKAVGKNHLVVRLGRERAVQGYALLSGSAYAFLILSVALGVLTLHALLALAALPYTYNAYATLKKHFATPMLLAPACASTVKAHLYAGVLLSLGYLLSRVL